MGKQEEHRNNVLTGLAFAGWLLCVVVWVYLDAFAGDYWPCPSGGKPIWVPWGNYAILKSILRVLVFVPLCTELCVWATNTFNKRTPEDWWGVITNEERSWGSKLAAALVLSAVIYGVFWLAIQV